MDKKFLKIEKSQPVHNDKEGYKHCREVHYEGKSEVSSVLKLIEYMEHSLCNQNLGTLESRIKDSKLLKVITM